jgi:DNA invertase Pin-like site-specific DNA recombinase
MLPGCARVSTHEQTLALQQDALARAGCERVFRVFAALAELERDVIRERTHAGLATARARGRKGGSPWAAALSDAEKVAIAQTLYDDDSHSIDDICKTLRVSCSTLYCYIRVKRKSPAHDAAT